MTSGPIPHYDDIRHLPIRSDDDALVRLAPLLGVAIRRQLWVLFLDEEGRPLPVLLPMVLESRPGVAASAGLGLFLADVARTERAAEIVVAYERRARPGLTDADRRWLRAIRAACLASGLRFRGPFLCHTQGVRAVAPDDYA